MGKGKAVSLTQAAFPLLQAMVKLNGKGTIPVLSCIKVVERNSESIALATDLDIAVEVRVDDNTAPGLYTIMGKELVPSRIDVKNFPELRPWTPVKHSVAVSTRDLAGMIPFISREESRYTLNGMLLEITPEGRIYLVATDGHRMRQAYAGDAAPGSAWRAIVPTQALKLLTRYAKDQVVTVREVEERHTSTNGKGEESVTVTQYLVIAAEGFAMQVRNVVGQFPDYRAVMPREAFRQVRVDRDALLEAVTAIMPYTDERTGTIRMTCELGFLRIYAENSEGYLKVINLPYQERDAVVNFDAVRFLARRGVLVIQMPMRDGATDSVTSFAFSGHYLLDILKSIYQGDGVYVGLRSAADSFMFTDADMLFGGELMSDERKAELAPKDREVPALAKCNVCREDIQGPAFQITENEGKTIARFCGTHCHDEYMEPPVTEVVSIPAQVGTEVHAAA